MVTAGCKAEDPIPGSSAESRAEGLRGTPASLGPGPALSFIPARHDSVAQAPTPFENSIPPSREEAKE
jgi:hypothetical protein